MRLPVGEDLCEWLAVNTVDFYNAISVLFGTLDEFCTVHSCSLMTAGPKVGQHAVAAMCAKAMQICTACQGMHLKDRILCSSDVDECSC